jgi:hypothetical protein
MVGCTRRPDKRTKVQFAEPPWSKRPDEWQILDQQEPANHPAGEVVEAMRQLDLESVCQADALKQPPRSGPAWMAKTPDTREGQRRRYRRARERLAELHAVNNRQERKRRRKRKKIVVSASDPDAALGRDKHNVFRSLCNVQLVRDLDAQLCLNYQVFAQPTDTVTFGPMLERVANWTVSEARAEYRLRQERVVNDSQETPYDELSQGVAAGLSSWAPFGAGRGGGRRDTEGRWDACDIGEV